MFLLSDSCCFRITPLDLFGVDSLIKALNSPSCPRHRKVIIKEKKGALISKAELPAWIWGSREDGELVCIPSLVFKSQFCHSQLGNFGQVREPLSSSVPSSRTTSGVVRFKESFCLTSAS